MDIRIIERVKVDPHGEFIVAEALGDSGKVTPLFGLKSYADGCTYVWKTEATDEETRLAFLRKVEERIDAVPPPPAMTSDRIVTIGVAPAQLSPLGVR